MVEYDATALTDGDRGALLGTTSCTRGDDDDDDARAFLSRSNAHRHTNEHIGGIIAVYIMLGNVKNARQQR